jgi:hypothetical protein
MTTEQLLTISDVARRLDIPAESVMRLAREGALTVVYGDREHFYAGRITADSLNEFQAQYERELALLVEGLTVWPTTTVPTQREADERLMDFLCEDSPHVTGMWRDQGDEIPFKGVVVAMLLGAVVWTGLAAIWWVKYR